MLPEHLQREGAVAQDHAVGRAREVDDGGGDAARRGPAVEVDRDAVAELGMLLSDRGDAVGAKEQFRRAQGPAALTTLSPVAWWTATTF